MLNVKLRQANHSDVPALKKLWQICFGDEMKYIDIFFDNMFIPEQTLVSEIDNYIAGVVYLLKRSLGDKVFLYGYAIGVLPEFRGKNICQIMLSKIKEYMDKNDYLFGLHPANEKLAHFYQRIGLNEMYSLKDVDATSFSYHEKFKLDDITEDEFFNMRKNAFKNSVDWDKNTLGYMLKIGETVKKVDIDGKMRYFVLSKHDKSLVVKETTANDNEILKVSQSIKEYFDAVRIDYLLSSDSTLQGDVKPMIYGFSKKDDSVYMNLFLD